MTDTDLPAASEAPPAEGANLHVLKQYVRDFSFESPKGPDAVAPGQGQPPIEMGVELSARQRPDGTYEVDLKLSARAGEANDAIFHVELVYGGLFAMAGVPEDQIEPLLMTECPRFLFPFARRIIADITSDGGFPAFLLPPMDFGAIYASRKAAALETAGNA